MDWRGHGLGHLGHSEADAPVPGEDPNDHGKPFPVLLPDNKSLTIGAMWSGSPYLGDMGSLPPGEGGLNPNAGFSFMWHSHKEKEMTSNNVFPGGMMTMFIVVPAMAMGM